MSVIPTTRGNPQASDIAVESALSVAGSSSRTDLQTVLTTNDSLFQQLYEDRNARFVGGGTVSLSSDGVTATFSERYDFVYNKAGTFTTVASVVAASGTITFTANGNFSYITLNRSAGTAALTNNATSLPAADSTHQEIFLLAIRRDDIGGTKRIYFREGTSIDAGGATRLGESAATFSDATFQVFDSSDNTKVFKVDAAGTTGTTTTLTTSQTANRVVTLPDAATTLAGLAVAQTFTQTQTFSASVGITPDTNGTRASGASATPWSNTFTGTVTAGTGDSTASPTTGTIQGATGTGSNITGGDLNVAAGLGTGSGGSGAIKFRTAPVAGSSSTPNTLANVGNVANDGTWSWGPATSTTTQHALSGSVVSGTAIPSFSSTSYRFVGNKLSTFVFPLSSTGGEDESGFKIGTYFDGTNDKYSANSLNGAAFNVWTRNSLSNFNFVWTVAQGLGGSQVGNTATFTTVGGIDGNGQWTIGGAVQAYSNLDHVVAGRVNIRTPSANGRMQWDSDLGTTGSHEFVRFDYLPSGVLTKAGDITIGPGATTHFNTSSDYRLKKNIRDFNALDMVSAMKPCAFEWIADDSGMTSYGFIAQELYTVLPQAVTRGDLIPLREGETPEKDQMWSVDYGKVTGVLTKALQELKAEFDAYVAAHP